MFCPHCGNESAADVNFCKRCGGSLNLPAQGSASEARPALSNGTAWAIGTSTFFTVVVGLGLLSSLIESSFRSGIAPGNVMTLMLFGAITILGSVALVVRLWMRVLGASPSGSKPAKANPVKPATPTSLLGGTTPEALPESSTAPVNEHATRVFDPKRRETR